MTTCKRCGTCCEKGGPVLHEADFPLVRDGKILLSELYTIRIGELVWDNVANEVLKTPDEMIKMKGTNGKAVCIRYQKEKGCTKYDSRPYQCQILACWDPSRTIKTYAQNRLTRKEIIKEMPMWVELIAAHEEILSYDRLQEQLQKLDGSAKRKLLRQTMQADFHFREVAQEYGINGQYHDFLLGRPLYETIHMFGNAFREEAKKFLETKQKEKGHP